MSVWSEGESSNFPGAGVAVVMSSLPLAGLLGLAFHELKVRAAIRAFFDVLMMVIP
jgi:hypothetical protein